MSSHGNLFENERLPDSEILGIGGDGLQVELIRNLTDLDSQYLMEISRNSVSEFGNPVIIEPGNFRKHFNYPRTFPFISRYQGKPVAAIIGVPLEQFNKESWVKYDINWGAENTVYTSLFIVHPQHRKPNITQTILKLYMSWIKKQSYRYITGHKRSSIDILFDKTPDIIKKFENWQNSKNTFDYFRITLI
ncbi:MAG TPA: hypothetical protein ENN84_11040 [Candidatus Marinimicrobia bacterium]|nr:hypothetical protein [Candidatus Neomarinimicrobiota bacterium]